MDTTILIPTFNEGANITTLVDALVAALPAKGVEILFVDDSTDDTPQIIEQVALTSPVPVRVLHRSGEQCVGGLSGAVTAGLAVARGTYVVVMDGDLQHPPALAPHLRDVAFSEGADVVVASRYCGEGDASGLSSSWRRTVSSSSTLLARTLFPRRVGRHCTDPMTGFFCVRREAVVLARLRPRGFKILLEILASHDLRVREVPFVFGERHAGESKASWRNGVAFLGQLLALRSGRAVRFAGVGALGFAVNLLAMAVLMGLGVHYLIASVLATELAIVHNFLMQERFVFHDLRAGGHAWRRRASQSALYNNIDVLLRTPVLAALVEVAGMGSILAQALTLVASFGARFFFTTRVVYRPRLIAVLEDDSVVVHEQTA